MLQCRKCESEIDYSDGDPVKCNAGCQSFLHYECEGMIRDDWKKKNHATRKKYKCEKCKTGKVDAQPEMEEATNQNSMEGIKRYLDDMEKRLQNAVYNIKQEMLEDNKIIKKEVQDVIESIGFANKKYEEMEKENAVMKEKIKELEERTKTLEGKASDKNEREEDLQRIKSTQNEMEQYSRNRNLEILGVEKPQEKPQENVREIVRKIAEVLQLDNFEAEQIEMCHRIPSRNTERAESIIVQFKSRVHREEWLEKRKKKVVTNAQIGNKDNKKRIYINEHMTQYYKQLFWKTKQYAKVKQIKFVWIKNSKIYIRGSEDQKEIRWIRKEEDLT